MKFEEKKFVTVVNYGKCFIYFLIKNDEVVYVGQTKKGLIRPLTHTDKEYDSLKIIYLYEIDQDVLEDFYIRKYNPIYNKTYNNFVNLSLTTARNRIRKIIGYEKFTIPKLRKTMLYLNIEEKEMNNQHYINSNDFEILYNFLKGRK